MFALINIYASPEIIVSRHRTLVAAIRAQAAHSRAVKRANGGNSYLPTSIREIRDGETVRIDEMALLNAEAEVYAR